MTSHIARTKRFNFMTYYGVQMSGLESHKLSAERSNGLLLKLHWDLIGVEVNLISSKWHHLMRVISSCAEFNF